MGRLTFAVFPEPSDAVNVAVVAPAPVKDSLKVAVPPDWIETLPSSTALSRMGIEWRLRIELLSVEHIKHDLLRVPAALEVIAEFFFSGIVVLSAALSCQTVTGAPW
jgi:hypothetical protein